MPNPATNALFHLGRILTKSRADDILEPADVNEAIWRHAHGEARVGFHLSPEKEDFA